MPVRGFEEGCRRGVDERNRVFAWAIGSLETGSLPWPSPRSYVLWPPPFLLACKTCKNVGPEKNRCLQVLARYSDLRTDAEPDSCQVQVIMRSQRTILEVLSTLRKLPLNTHTPKHHIKNTRVELS